MPTILRDIVFALARAALATFLAKELYSITVPTLALFSLMTLSIITRDPLRDSLPPFLSPRDIFALLWGRRLGKGDKRRIVRLSVFARDVFWVSNQPVLKEFLVGDKVRPVYYGNGIVMPYGDKERGALEKVCRCVICVAERRSFRR
jgi:hypothetical protein